MRIHYFQHVPFEGLGCIGQWAVDHGHELSVTQFYREEPLPRVEEIDWLVIMGGPMNIYEEAEYPWLAGEMQRQPDETFRVMNEAMRGLLDKLARAD